MLNYVKYIKTIEKLLIYAYNNFFKQNFSLTDLHYYIDWYKVQIHANKTTILYRKISKVFQWKLNFISNSIHEKQIINSIISQQSTRERLNKIHVNH